MPNPDKLIHWTQQIVAANQDTTLGAEEEVELRARLLEKNLRRLALEGRSIRIFIADGTHHDVEPGSAYFRCEKSFTTLRCKGALIPLDMITGYQVE